MDKVSIENALGELPIVQFDWIESRELEFSERIRSICKNECPMYNTTWACPPAVGTVEECRARCLNFPHALLFTTVTEVRDVSDMQETLSTRAAHEEIAHQVAELLRAQSEETLVLSTEACCLCEHCAWPEGQPCRHPDKMFPCVESHGIVATAIAEKHGIEFFCGNIVTWFSLVFYK